MLDYEYLFKFIMIGDSNVGKSCLLLRFIQNRFRGQHQPTIGVEFGSRIIRINDKPTKIQIWDTAGQQSFKSITTAYYKGSIAALLVFDLSVRSSFLHLKYWLDDLRNHSHPKIQIVLIGNKSDLQKEREISIEQIDKFCKEHQIAHYYQTSAYQAINTQKPFLQLANKIMKMLMKGQISPEEENMYGVKRNKKNKRYPHPVHLKKDEKKQQKINNCPC